MIRFALSRQGGLGQKGKYGVLPHLSAAEALPRSPKTTASLRASRREKQPLLALAGSPAATEARAGESPAEVRGFPLSQTPGQPCPWALLERSDARRSCGGLESRLKLRRSVR